MQESNAASAKGSQAAIKAWASRRLKAGIPKQLSLAIEMSQGNRMEVGRAFIVRVHAGNEILSIPHLPSGPGAAEPVALGVEQYKQVEYKRGWGSGGGVGSQAV